MSTRSKLYQKNQIIINYPFLPKSYNMQSVSSKFFIKIFRVTEIECFNCLICSSLNGRKISRLSLNMIFKCNWQCLYTTMTIHLDAVLSLQW